MSMKDNELEHRLRIEIKRELASCTPSVTPKFCEMKKTKEGYLKAEAMIIEFAIKNQVSISAAIGQLESELE